MNISLQIRHIGYQDEYRFMMTAKNYTQLILLADNNTQTQLHQQWQQAGLDK